MANSFEILVKGDFTQVTKGFVDLSKKLEDISKKQFGFKMDADTKKFLTGGGEVVLKRLKNSLKEAQIGMSEMAKTAGKSNFDFKNFEQAADRVSKLQTQINSVERTINRATTGRTGKILMNLLGRGARAMGAGEGAIGAAEGLGGMLGGTAGTIATVGAMVAVGAGYGMYKAGKNGWNAWSQPLDTKLGLFGMGMGRRQMNGLINGGQNAMFSPEETLKQAYALMASSGSAKNLGSMQLMSRSLGIDMGQLIGVSGSLRQAGNSNNAVIRQMSIMIGDSVASGLERSRIGEYLSMISSYTGQLTQQNFGGVGTADVSRAVASVMAGNVGFFSQPGGAIQGLSAMDANIRSAIAGQGMNLGFVQQQLSKLYPGAAPEKTLMMGRRGLFQQLDQSQLDDAVSKGLLTKEEAADLQGKPAIDVARQLIRGSLQYTKNMSTIQKGRMISANVFGGAVPEAQSLMFARGIMSPNSEVAQATMKQVNDAMKSDMERIRDSTEGTEKNTRIMAQIFSYMVGESFAKTAVGAHAAYERITQQMIGGGQGPSGFGKNVTKLLSATMPGGPLLFDLIDNWTGGKMFSSQNASDVSSSSTLSIGGLKAKSVAILNSMSQIDPRMQAFASALNTQMIDKFGTAPIITDTFLDKINHSRNSAHYSGEALDYRYKGMTPEMVELAKTIGQQYGVNFQLHTEAVIYKCRNLVDKLESYLEDYVWE